MKTLIILMFCSIIALSSCGPEKTTQEIANINSSDTISEGPKIDDEALSALNDLGNVDIDKGLFSVELNVPASFVEGKSQEDLDKLCEEKGYKSITLNDDGSATYIITKEQHKEMINDITTSIDESLNDLIGSENYPDFKNIEVNDNYTEFIVTTTSTELGMGESFSTLAFYIYGGMFNVFNGTEAKNISVIFVNADTGEIISTANSSDIE